MYDSEPGHTASGPPAAQAGGAGNVTLFLGLFLLILAFFILLVSISSISENRLQGIMRSLTSTFSDLAAPVTELTQFSSKSGEVLSPEEFQQLISGIFSAAVAVDQIEIVEPGRTMRLDLRANELFVVNKPAVRDTRLDLMDRIVGALSASPAGQRFEISFLIGGVPSDEGTMPIEQTLESRRAGSFARTVIERGAPPASVSVGIAPGNPKKVSIYFYARDEEAARVQFEPSAAATDGFTYDDADTESDDAEIESEAVEDAPAVSTGSAVPIPVPVPVFVPSVPEASGQPETGGQPVDDNPVVPVESGASVPLPQTQTPAPAPAPTPTPTPAPAQTRPSGVAGQ